jgi:hypothetical protein
MKSGLKKNDEARMTKDEGSPNAQMTKTLNAPFGIWTSSFFRN